MAQLLLIADTLLEAGEFSIDLYTMPDILTKMLWDHLVSASSQPHSSPCPRPRI